MTSEAARSGPVGLTERAPAPDLARGAMLLLIALAPAPAPAYLFGRPHGTGGYPAAGTALDHGVVFAELTAVVGRGYPMFAALMGYGLAQLWARQTAAGRTSADVRRLVRRRGAWLVVFGLAHAALLWAGDILGAYGVITMLLGAGLLRASDRLIATLGALSLAVVTAGGVTDGLTDLGGGTSALASTGESSWWVAVCLRLEEWAPSLLLQPLGMLGAVLAGVWAARRRLLERPEHHVGTLRRVAGIGLAVAFGGAIPWAAIVAGWWADPPRAAAAVASGLHAGCGYAGVAYAAAMALIVHRSGAPGPVQRALIAGGRRSLTCYLLQSVVLVTVLASYGGGLGGRIGSAAAAAVAVGTWLLTVGIAVGLERARARGPAEVALRALTYRER